MISGFFSNHGNVCGAGRWGYPIYWKWRMVTSPEYSPPMEYVWTNFVIDIIIWSVIIFVILVLIYRKDLFKK